MKMYKQLGIILLLSIAACEQAEEYEQNFADDTSIYLNKSSLLAYPTPEIYGENGWLYNSIIVKSSAPSIFSGGFHVYLGLQSDTRLVNFRFAEDALQIIDFMGLQDDSPEDLATQTDKVLLSFKGEHVNMVSSGNGPAAGITQTGPWQDRNIFKVDFEKGSSDPLSNFGWLQDLYLTKCVDVDSTHLVPDSFEWIEEDQYLTFVLEVNYSINLSKSWCSHLLSISAAATTAQTSVHYKFNFYRRAPGSYQPEVIAEKAKVNKKFGVFQTRTMFRDAHTGLLGSQNLISRYDPNRNTPVKYYFAKGFPERYKAMFRQMGVETNDILRKAGAKLRFSFHDFDEGGIIRQNGDIRYSFVIWHQSIDAVRGILGYGPSIIDPRTGEIISANVHMYNIGMDYYRYLIENYLSEFAPEKNNPCDTQSIPKEKRPLTPILKNMVSTLGMDIGQTISSTKTYEIRSPDIRHHYSRLLNELRFAEPSWNPYVTAQESNTIEQDFSALLESEHQFQKNMKDILLNGTAPSLLLNQDAINQKLQFLTQFSTWVQNHNKLQAIKSQIAASKNIDIMTAKDALWAISQSARKCIEGRPESDEEFSQRVIDNIVYDIGLHEFGHTLSLRHNFYGSVDAANHRPHEVTSSIMDYVSPQHIAYKKAPWGKYDIAALTWIYGNEEARQKVMSEHYLYCTDEHTQRSPLCNTHDLGVTPAEITLNAIERYDWMYEIRNKRAFRKFWNTSNYVDDVFDSIFSPLGIWYMGLFDLSGDQPQQTLKRLDLLEGRLTHTPHLYDSVSQAIKQDVDTSVMMTMAFYDAVASLPSEVRDHRSKFDAFYGDLEVIGVGIDKLFALFAFTGLNFVENYDPDINTAVAMYDLPLSTRAYALSKNILDRLLQPQDSNYPWLQYFPLLLFASASNSDFVNDGSLKERIAVRRYNNLEDLENELGIVLDNEIGIYNTEQTFQHNGDTYVYTYIRDRGWHLIASRSRNPVSYKYILDYNMEILEQGNGRQSDFGLKLLLSYYEFFNNPSGY